MPLHISTQLTDTDTNQLTSKQIQQAQTIQKTNTHKEKQERQNFYKQTQIIKEEEKIIKQ